MKKTILNKQVDASCRLGGRENCCIFLTFSKGQWECSKGTDVGDYLLERHGEGKTTAKGLGGWDSCIYK